MRLVKRVAEYECRRPVNDVESLTNGMPCSLIIVEHEQLEGQATDHIDDAATNDTSLFDLGTLPVGHRGVSLDS